ncbi:MAG: LysM peptidoglycan-binding domain-containing protein [Verrucomicrobiaceae bacterium]|nr:MAG: LysM peptidoglycan-binding domain-containing protein [Verrucomicrobiaceae bacterium]
MHPMTPIRILAPALVALAFTSCASQKADQYDTANPYGAADASQINAPVEPSNPVYDTPAAYEESSATAASAPTDAYIPSASPNIPASPAAPAAPSNGAAIIHTVVAGDTLSGISAKYKVPSAAIKQANNMTKDTVILGKKMVIPPVR